MFDRLVGWRIKTLRERETSVMAYIEYRLDLDKKLKHIRDWMIRSLLWIRRLMNRTTLTLWLWCLRLRLSIWRKIL